MVVAIHEAEQLARYRQARLSRDGRFDGQFFVAVKSTGIFCRPICPARLPKEENVDYYQHATQAIHAGFRPCLRCRPDSAPASHAWNGVNTTVARAEALLSEIPPKPVSRVAARLGVSERYLHKLMRDRVGMSPSQWQKYQQLLFAKRLLQQSSLPVDGVATASGFGSARRLQSAMKNLWDISPTQLRKGSLPKQSTTPVIQVMLYYRQPYNWPFVRDFLLRRAIHPVEDISTNKYRRIFNGEACQGVVEAEHQPEKSGFSVSLTIDELSGARAILDNLCRVLDLHADPQLVERALLNAGIAQRQILPGIRLPGVWNAFEAGCRAVLGQQVSVKAAINNVMKLVAHLGESTPFGLAFPLPDAVANDELAFLKIPGARKQALRNIAAFYATKARREDAYSGVDSCDVSNQLLALKGIGPWTVDYLMMRGESDPDRYLEGDLIVRQVAETMTLTPAKSAPWQSYLTLQLWYLADKLKEDASHV